MQGSGNISVIDRIESKVAKRIVIYDTKTRHPITGQPDCRLKVISKQYERKKLKEQLLERYVRIMEIKLWADAKK